VIRELMLIGKFVKEMGKADEYIIPYKTEECDALIRIIVNLDDENISISSIDFDDEEDRDNTLKSYNYIGNALAKNPQYQIVTTGLEFLLGTHNNPKKHALDVLPYFLEERLGDAESKELVKMLRRAKKILYSRRDEVLDELSNYRRRNGINKSLYTISIEIGNKTIDVAKTKPYKRLLILAACDPKAVTFKAWKRSKKMGRCHVCGTEGIVYVNPGFPGGTLLKIFTLDKRGFIPMLKKSNEEKPFATCERCFENIVIGFNYILRNLKFEIQYLSGICDVIVIPSGSTLSLVSKSSDPASTFREFVNTTTSILKAIFAKGNNQWNYSKLLTFFKRITKDAKYLSLRMASYHIIIGAKEAMSSEYGIYAVMWNVPSSRIYKIIEALKKISEFATNTMQIPPGMVCNKRRDVPEYDSIDLECIMRALPKRNDVKPRGALELMKAIIEGNVINDEVVVDFALRAARVHYYENYANVNIIRFVDSDAGTRLAKSSYLFLLINQLLTLLGCIDMEHGSLSFELGEDRVLGEYQKLFKEFGYDDVKAALFMMGVVIADIARAQYLANMKSKPILNKLNFNGMGKERIISLTSELLEKIRIYISDPAEYTTTEKKYSYMTRLLVGAEDELTDPKKNVFYILLGYGFETLRFLSGGGRKDEE